MTNEKATNDTDLPDFDANHLNQHFVNLKSARSGGLKNAPKNIGAIKKNIKSAINMGSLIQYADPFTDWLFGIALTFAVLKDILDLVDTALISIGGLGIVLLFITTTLCSLTIWMIMMLTGSLGKKSIARSMAKRIALLITTTVAEYIPGISILPLESLVVIIIVWLTLKERKESAEKEKEDAKQA